jgi:EAL domain-containing protein (putative c-di-GMP-specific phosphodiesterase class I)
MSEEIRVLVVVDHEMVAQNLMRLLGDDPSLEVIGHEFSAQAGIDRALVDRPDVVIMDYAMPDMDGAVATRLLKSEYTEVQVVMLTGSEGPEAHSAAMEAGSAAWVRTSRATYDLLAVVHLAVSGQRVVATEYETELPPLNELVVYYQPIVRLADHSLAGFEALVRWQHPKNGLLLPMKFLPLAEKTGYISDIGRHVTREALRDFSQWTHTSESSTPLFVSINMSATGLSSAGMAEELLDMVASARVEPSSVIVEITETTLLGDSTVVENNVRALQSGGVRLALDDFGTAFSSLSYLRRFPFDVVKIDTSFTAELPRDPRAVLLVQTVVEMAITMSAVAIAEGIEREDQERVLVDAGWTLGQGFLYSRPVSYERAKAMVSAGAVK